MRVVHDLRKRVPLFRDKRQSVPDTEPRLPFKTESRPVLRRAELNQPSNIAVASPSVQRLPEPARQRQLPQIASNHHSTLQRESKTIEGRGA